MNDHQREDGKTLIPSFWIRVVVGALVRFAVDVAWKLINSKL
jgi:hypothetical protein